jgi:integrase
MFLDRLRQLRATWGMPRRPQLLVTETPKGFKVDIPASLSASRKRERFFYQCPKQAAKHAKGILKAYHLRGTQAGTIDPALASDALKAVSLLEPFGVSLMDVVREYVKRNDHAGARQTVEEAWTEYQALLVRKERSAATLADYVRDKKSLPAWFLALKVSEATPAIQEKALDECTGNRGMAWNRKLRSVRSVLREALRTDIKPHDVRRKDPVILTAKEAGKLMALAAADGCALPFALMLFAGIRPKGELGRISWGSIKEDFIEISSEDSKTNDERHIPISDNLRAWLDSCKGHDIIPENWAVRYPAIRKTAGITGQDVLRHTFASMFYRLNTEKETIDAMGHSSFKTTERFYKRAVKKDDAAAFFAIVPQGVEAPPVIQPVEEVA